MSKEPRVPADYAPGRSGLVLMDDGKKLDFIFLALL